MIKHRGDNPLKEPGMLSVTLLVLALIFVLVFLLIPIIATVVFAFAGGLSGYISGITSRYALSSIALTLKVIAIVVPLNLIFGLALAWLVSRFSFVGRGLIITIIDLPLAISPVVVGLAFTLLFGINGVFGSLIQQIGIEVIFSTPGIIVTTLFVTSPIIARELIPLLEYTGRDEESVALTLGASPLRAFLSVTLPNLRWGIFSAMALCNARAMGEFGAVSVVSGHIRGLTHTVPLEIEVLYNEYNFTSAFALSTTLLIAALLTLVIKRAINQRYGEN